MGDVKKDMTLFEVSWEVCNKVGGIYTVLASKMPLMLSSIDNYFAIGPYDEKHASLDLIPEKPPARIASVFRELEKSHGMRFHYGKWVIKTTKVMEQKPTAILIDPGAFSGRANDIKKEMWDDFRIDTIRSSPGENDVWVWAKAVGLLIEEMVRQGAVSKKNLVGHFHEFLSGMAMLHLKKSKVPIKSVFLTHATILGRSIAGTGREDLYSMVNQGIKSRRTIEEHVAKEYNIEDKFTLEKACALNSDVFATVSEITARECQFMFGRKPDVMLYNGLDMSRFPHMESLSDLHIQYRDEIKKFLSGYFAPYYDIDLSDALIFFISGRFEFRNKGVDMFIDALGRLNQRLRKSGDKRHVVAFVWVPANVREIRHDVEHNLGLFRELEEAIQRESRRVGDRVLRSFTMGKEPSKADLFDQEFLYRVKETRMIYKKSRGQDAPLSPFVTDDNDVLKALRRNGLNNSKDDVVKVIYYPTYLSASDGMLSLSYYNAMMGCHVGVFPSYYEPWGYTPLESSALGLQTITSDLAGFGLYIKPKLKNNDMSISVINRNNKPYEDSVRELESLYWRIYKAKGRDRVMSKIRAKELSGLADWNNMIKNYLKAYDMALKK